MAAKKQSKHKNGRAKATASASGHFPIVLSTAVRERAQHDGGRHDVGISAALSSDGKALLVIAQRERVYQGSLILSLQLKTRIWLTNASDRVT